MADSLDKWIELISGFGGGDGKHVNSPTHAHIDSSHNVGEEIQSTAAKSIHPNLKIQKHVIDPFLTFLRHTKRADVSNSSLAIQQQKQLELTVSGIRRHVNREEEQKSAWMQNMCQVVAHLIFYTSLEPKVNRKSLTLLVELEKCSYSTVEEELKSLSSSLLSVDVDASTLSLWCQLCDISGVAREIVEANVNRLASILASHLQIEMMRDESWTLSRQEALQVHVKFIIQILQRFGNKVSLIVWENTDGTADGEALKSWQDITTCLISLLQRQDSPKDSSLLAGTALALLLNLSKDTEITASLIITLFNLLTSAASLSLSIGALQIELPSNQSSPAAVATVANQPQLTFGHMTFLNGVVSCSSPALFSSNLVPATPDIFAMWLFDCVYDLCQITQFQYHAFRLLLQWYAKSQQNIAQIITMEPFFTNQTQPKVRVKTMKLVWTNLDSPVDGVNEIAIDVFKALLKVLRKEEELLDTTCNTGFVAGFIEETKQLALQMSWNVKGKHFILASIIPEIDSKKFLLDEGSRLWSPLLNCLRTNFLTPPATQLYKAIVLTLRSSHTESDAVSLWQELCMPHLLQALLSEERLLCYNSCQFWLVWTVKILSPAYSLLLRHLESSLQEGEPREPYLRALMALLRVGRLNALLHTIPEQYVCEALCHVNDDLRLDAFAVLCDSMKKAEGLSPVELALLKTSLPLSLNSDCPPFRQQLSALLRTLLCRARDSCLAQLKANQPLDMQTIGFVSWFWRLCVEYLQPGKSYQTTIACLEWMWVLLDCFVYVPERRQKKGSCPENSQKLFSAGGEIGGGEGGGGGAGGSEHRLQLFTARSAHTILSCLLCGTQDVRELACRILTIFFPWPLPFENAPTLPLVSENAPTLPLLSENAPTPQGSLLSCALYQTGISLCHSPRPPLSHAGALICGIIFEKCVLENGETFELTEQNEVSAGARKEREQAALLFFRQLVYNMKKGQQLAQNNILLASKTAPIHGFTLAIQQCLKYPGFWKSVDLLIEWRGVMADMLDILRNVMEHGRQVLGAKIHKGEETAPSFEEMGRAIAALITESRDGGDKENNGEEEEDNDETSLSPDHQMLMTWAWINIKESSILIGQLVSCVPTSEIEEEGVLSVQQVEDLGQLMYTVLTKCRHRGAIEGCNVGLLRYCSHLLCDSRAAFYSLPATLLQQVLQQVTGASQASSITRRSAGLPLIAQTILASESKAKQSVLLESCLATLFSVLEQPVPTDQDATLDLPQTHALNLLRALFREAALAGSMATWTGRAAQHSIHGLASPVWAVRNSAMQLFSTLINRMVGQKKTKADHVTSMTAGEFFTHYPELEGYLLAQVGEAVMEHSAGMLHPSLFPALSILARLSCGTATETGIRVMHALEAHVRSLASSPIYGVRELAAKALVPLVSSPDQQIFSLLDELEQSRRHGRLRMNWLHGTLLQMEHLIKASAAKRSTRDERDSLIDRLLNEAWLVRPENPCHLVRAQYLRVLASAAENLCMEENQQAENNGSAHQGIQRLVHNTITEFLAPTQKTQEIQYTEEKVIVGMDRFVDELLSLWLKQTTVGDKVIVLSQCLNSSTQDPHVISAALQLLQKQDEQTWRALMPCLLELVMQSTQQLHYNCQCHLLHLLLHLHLSGCTFRAPAGLYQHLLDIIRKEQNSRASAVALAVSAIIVAEDTGSVDLCAWSQLLETCCEPIQANLLRLHAAHALAIAGRAVLADSASPPAVHVSLLKCCVHLLVDEQTDTRRLAADFVQTLPWQHPHKFSVIHPNFALQMVFEYWASNYCHAGLLHYLFELLDWQEDTVVTLQKSTNIRVDELFSAQDLNPFREKCVINELALKTIMHIISTPLDSRMRDVIEMSISHVQEDLKKAYHTLDSLCTASSVLVNGSCDSDGFRALHSLYSVAHVALCWFSSQKRLTEAQHISAALSKHTQLPCFHPALAAFIKEALTV